ncbi:ImmA/IrrE family metallo-endopeptidase [bacterium]|nr:ImmA/IrrE family metallo-endopeptidase [bacterium]
MSLPCDYPDVPVIVVNQGHVLERRRHTLAHELAHRLVVGPEEWIEKAVDRLAGALLVPERPVLAELGRPRHSVSYREIILLKQHFRVSAISLWVRLSRLGIINESTYQNAYRTFARGWRSVEPEAIESKPGSLEQPNRFQRLCFRALSEGLISLVKASELLQLPVDDVLEGWRGPED